MSSLEGKLALVTGASRGIGAATAETLGKAGAHVILVARTAKALEEVEERIHAAGGSATIASLDLAKGEDIGKLGVLLVQLPPKLEFDAEVAARFFEDLARRSPAAIACEPRHTSWFDQTAGELLAALRVARVAADPARCEGAGEPGGWRGLSYWRLHGSPVIYRSSYADRIDVYADALRAEAKAGRDTWCIFDNTASSAAIRAIRSSRSS